MTVSITHAKTNTITDWTQAQLDAIIAGGAAPLPPTGTVLADVTLPSDWNAEHLVEIDFTDLGDVPSSYTGAASKFVKVKSDETGLEFVTGSGASVIWGDITGTLSDQTDLQAALDGKVDENSPITGATKTKITYDAKGLVTAGADATTSDIAEGSNLYFTDERAQDAVGGILVDSSTIDLTYNDGTPSITATVIDNTNIQKIEVVKNSGSVVGTRKQLNFIEGTNVTLTIADDAGNDQIDITIAATGGGGGSVSDVTAGDATVDISPTTGNVVVVAHLPYIMNLMLMGA